MKWMSTFTVGLTLLGLGARAADLPNYPRVDLAVGYEVDPSWPLDRDPPLGAVPGIAIDANDQVWVHTRVNPPVRLYDSKGKLLRSWGDRYIKSAHHLKIAPDGNIWVADVGNHVVMEFTPDGEPKRVLGTVGVAGEDDDHLNMPTDMAITQDGQVFVSDGYGNSRVVHFDPEGRCVRAWGKMGNKPGEFSCPHAIALDSKGRLYVADRNNCRVQVFQQDGSLVTQWLGVVTPWGFSISPQDDIWVCGSSPTQWKYSADKEPMGCPPRDQLFMRFDTSGKLQQLWTVPKGVDGREQPGDLNWVHCLALDSKGNIYAGDIMGKRVQKFVRVTGASP